MSEFHFFHITICQITILLYYIFVKLHTCLNFNFLISRFVKLQFCQITILSNFNFSHHSLSNYNFVNFKFCQITFFWHIIQFRTILQPFQIPFVKYILSNCNFVKVKKKRKKNIFIHIISSHTQNLFLFILLVTDAHLFSYLGVTSRHNSPHLAPIVPNT